MNDPRVPLPEGVRRLEQYKWDHVSPAARLHARRRYRQLRTDPILRMDRLDARIRVGYLVEGASIGAI
ncbi:hypothetical protein K6U06_19755 [Acidiferrimicrobium sp. IK]|uniref:hypothetical protein n=1 Tax=Acidiferrimicrobium sp. IK TaxID=2871700 RepID=UPI0021CB3935|nr:hypothetical protein [Acidiferrimicrobium sp. IK]MCU4186610.1 hypothetical protein [Acidiferrimicrobium sp. IK]